MTRNASSLQIRVIRLAGLFPRRVTQTAAAMAPTDEGDSPSSASASQSVLSAQMSDHRRSSEVGVGVGIGFRLSVAGQTMDRNL